MITEVSPTAADVEELNKLESSSSPTAARKNDEVEISALSGWKLALVITGLCLAIFLMALDTSIIATAIPKITTHFGSTEDIGWYGGAYLFSLCSLQPLGGKLYSNFSLKVLRMSILKQQVLTSADGVHLFPSDLSFWLSFVRDCDLEQNANCGKGSGWFRRFWNRNRNFVDRGNVSASPPKTNLPRPHTIDFWRRSNHGANSRRCPYRPCLVALVLLHQYPACKKAGETL